MKKFLLLLIMLFLSSLQVLAQQGIDFKTSKRPISLLRQECPIVYKLTRLIIGKENKFLIKAEPGSNVILAVSNSNTGAIPFHGQKLRLGADTLTKEGIVPVNGLLELNITLPDDKDLNEKIMYFEAVIWKNKDFSDIKIAQIMAPSGRETENNGILVSLPPEDASKPTFAPTIPGAPIEMLKTMKFIEDMKKGKCDDKELCEDSKLYKDKEAGSYYQKPVMLRNLESPDLLKQESNTGN